MEITLSKRLFFAVFLLSLSVVTAVLTLPRLTGRPLAQSVGFDSGRSAALAGARAFYSVDYTTGSDQWAARLCALSTQPACELYQNTIAPFLWADFNTAKTIVSAQATDPVLVAEDLARDQENASTQVWQVQVTLTAPWPQGDGQTSFPAHVLVIRESNQWKFERFLLNDELARYNGGEQ